MSKSFRLLSFLALASLLTLPGPAWAGTAVLLREMRK